jgi:hypothetical protein
MDSTKAQPASTDEAEAAAADEKEEEEETAEAAADDSACSAAVMASGSVLGAAAAAAAAALLWSGWVCCTDGIGFVEFVAVGGGFIAFLTQTRRQHNNQTND